ncbi:MAG: YbaB/EbfC family nucleoid-associated protein [Erysipelotrichaceae bacterium]|nr:YbaB/EbfC family nucleoid-associated protein [Erysipelotrichaceae bacterium]
MNQMQQMLMQAQRMQRELQKAHEALEQQEFVVEKAGLVKVTLTGDRKIKSLEITPDALNADDAEMIQDTIMAAVNEALEQIQAANDKIDEEITGRKGGMGF